MGRAENNLGGAFDPAAATAECGGLRIQPFYKFLPGQGHYPNRLLNENIYQSIVLRGDVVIL